MVRKSELQESRRGLFPGSILDRLREATKIWIRTVADTADLGRGI
jgi:hypothetical protein